MSKKLWILIEDRINIKQLWFTALLGTAGLILNLFPIPLFANLQLVLGYIPVVMVAILLGPWYALLAALIASSSLLYLWESPHVYLIYCAEALWLGFAVRRGHYALYACFCYWLFMGTPLFYLYASLFTDLPNFHLPFIFLKHTINGLIYTSLASVIIIVSSQYWNKYSVNPNRERRSFSSQLTYVFTMMLTLSLLISALIFSHKAVHERQLLLQQNLQSSAKYLGKSTQDYLSFHQTAINNAAHWLGSLDEQPRQIENVLKSMHHQYPGFSNLLITNTQGSITHASGYQASSFLNPNNVQPQRFQKREYFRQAFKLGNNDIKQFVEISVLGGNPIMTIAAPIFTSSKPNRFIGVIEGSLELASLKNTNSYNEHDLAKHVIVVDGEQRIIYASDSLGLPILSAFKYAKKGNKIYNTNLQLINLHELSNVAPEYFYSKFDMDNGWSFYIVEDFSLIIESIEQQYKITFIFMILSIFVAMFLAKRTSKRLTLPLELIAHHFGQLSQNSKDDFLLDHFAPAEIYKLYHRLRATQRQLLSHKLQLENTVSARTKELEQVNQKLKQLAEQDELTGLYNRRYAVSRFETVRELCLRSQDELAIVILDLDRFKRINDTYGHSAGDECLKSVARLLEQHFKRESDIVARYGGEEFLLILPMCNPNTLEEHLNNFRVALAKLPIISPQDQQIFHIKTSIGAVVANASYHPSLEKWINPADNNLYLAKDTGRNRVILSSLQKPNKLDEKS